MSCFEMVIQEREADGFASMDVNYRQLPSVNLCANIYPLASLQIGGDCRHVYYKDQYYEIRIFIGV